MMIRGIDVSENNGVVDWQAVRDAGIKFAILRLGWGNRHLDEQFYANINGARSVGIELGVYYYSYALNEKAAENEADFVIEVLEKCGLAPEDLPYGVWFDMEDADGYKARQGMPSDYVITAMCSRFICKLNDEDYPCGIYASLDWLQTVIRTQDLADYVPYWVAQWDTECDWADPTLWQFTDNLYIDGKFFDGNYDMR